MTTLANGITVYACLKAGQCDRKYNEGWKKRCITNPIGYVSCPYNPSITTDQAVPVCSDYYPPLEQLVESEGERLTW
jgi:hypothetical protein